MVVLLSGDGFFGGVVLSAPRHSVRPGAQRAVFTVSHTGRHFVGCAFAGRLYSGAHWPGHVPVRMQMRRNNRARRVLYRPAGHRFADPVLQELPERTRSEDIALAEFSHTDWLKTTTAAPDQRWCCR